jgi:mannosyltransferase OCH1-like enzyme
MIPQIPKESEDAIPKIIHQTWKTNDVPEHWKSSHDEWLSFDKNGQWTYLLWTDEMNRELVSQLYPWFLEKYDQYADNIQRADVIRYFILYTYGGIYCDLDIKPKKSFLKLFQLYEEEDIVIAKSASSHKMPFHPLTNSFMMSKPGCVFWKYVFEEIISPWSSKNGKWKHFMSTLSRHWRIIFTTGPGPINSAWKRYRENGHDLKSIPMEYIQPLQEWESRPCDTTDSHVTLLANGSWHKSDSIFFRRLSRFWNNSRDVFFGSMILILMILFITFMVLYIQLRSKLTAIP